MGNAPKGSGMDVFRNAGNLRLRITIAVLLLTVATGMAGASAAHGGAAPYPPVADTEQSPPYQSKKHAPFCTDYTGPYQKELERLLGLRPVDGSQSAADCKAIQAFQQHLGIKPDIGYAGTVTHGTALLIEARKNPDPYGRCPPTVDRIVCLDLSRQLLWVQRAGHVTFIARPVRTGARGFATRTGWHRIYWRSKDHYSTLYDTPMPYSQFFSGGQAFHAHDGSVYAPPGSHGCVNLRYADAKALWSHLADGVRVYAYGRKPGT